ncbi:hypothetical protein STHU_49210 [Allostella humosa]|uniref:hypothetical protein n=1 Tax=Stella humosa TaxID=94 RepID=UPI001139E155|nr:hypothetical protein [Stella humosa]BBK34287.1 hypothetical protein STHU_49210 [Stella humosa]
MADPPDSAALARRFVTLWQEQMLAVAADPAMAEATARWLSLFAPAASLTQAFSAPAFAAPPVAPAAATGAQHDPVATPAPAGTAAAAGASGAGGHDLDQLARRMAALEERIAGLESALRGTARRPRRTAPRRRS